MPTRYCFLLSGALIILLTNGVWALSFTEEPTDTIVPAGSSVTLPCTVDQGPVQYSWFKNRAPVSLGGDFAQAADGSLTISVPVSVTTRNYEKYDGVYHCVVSKQQHELWSRDARVLVSRCTTRGKFGGQTANQTGLVAIEAETVAVIQEGHLVSDQPAWHIACSSSQGKKKLCPSTDCSLPYKLYPIERQKSMSVLLFTVAQLQTLTGKRGCRSFTLASTWEKNPSQNFLHVNFIGFSSPPKRIVVPVDTKTAAGSAVTLPCRANQPSSYSWTKDAMPINANTDSRITLVDGSLHIESVIAADAGKYVCTAGIQKSHSREPATLTVYSLPAVKLSLSRKGSQLDVTCSVSGSSPLKAEILLDGSVKRTKILDSFFHKLTHSMRVVTGGYIQCVASNTYGSVQTSSDVSTATGLPTKAVLDITTSTPRAQASTNTVQETEGPKFHEHTDSNKQVTTEQPTARGQQDSTKQPTQETPSIHTQGDSTEKPTRENPTVHGQGDSTKQPTREKPTVHGQGDSTKQPTREKPAGHGQGDSVKQPTAEEPKSKQSYVSHTTQSTPGVVGLQESARNDESSGGLSSGAAAGIAMATIAVIAVVIALIIWKKHQPKQRILRDVMAGKYGMVKQNPTYQDVDDLEKAEDNKPTKGRGKGSATTATRAELSRIGVDHEKATISIGTESKPVLQKANSMVSCGAPDHVMVGEDLYAVSTKSRSNTPKPHEDTEASQSGEEPTGVLLHYQMGDDEYAIAMKTDSSQSLTIPEDNDESMPYADLDELTDELTVGLDNPDNDGDLTYAALSSVM